jgi:hypothetical protein
MAIIDPVSKAEAAPTAAAAAALDERLAAETRNPNLTPQARQEVADARTLLTDKWGLQLQEGFDDVTKSRQRAGQARRHPQRGAPPAHPRARARAAAPGRSRQRAPVTRGRVPRAVRRAYRTSGAQAAVTDTSRTFLQYLAGAVGLSMAYLFLRNADRSRPGRSAIELVGGTVATAVHALVSPIDPLAPKATAGGGKQGGDFHHTGPTGAADAGQYGAPNPRAGGNRRNIGPWNTPRTSSGGAISGAGRIPANPFG